MATLRPSFLIVRYFSLSALAALVAASVGCDGKREEVPLVPVSGVVKLGGAPMPMGTVEFHPDAGKGNTFKGIPKAAIQPDGKYKLISDGREGAPLGWYKVTVSGQGMPDMSKMGGDKPPTPPTVPAKYAKPDTSGFSFEVKDGAPAGAYDLSLSK